jgi:hypothetical protein
MKSIALFGFILLGTVCAHRLHDSETALFLNEHGETVQSVQSVGNILEDSCIYEIDGSIYNLNGLKDTKKNYEVPISGLDESFNTFKVVFNMCKELENAT